MSKHDSATHIDPEAFSEADLLLDAARRGVRYRASLARRPVAPGPEAVARLDLLKTPLPDAGRDPHELLALLDDVAGPATVAMAGGRYFGFVNGSSLPVTVAANWLATAWDQNCALHTMSPAAATLESIALRWLAEVLRLPAGGGALVSGATLANLTALAAARHAVLRSVGWDVDNEGLAGAPPVTIVVGAEVHATVRRVLGLLGFGRLRTRTLPVDAQGRIRCHALPELRGPTILCIQAGNVNSGAFDPAGELCAWAHAAGAWVHVDGAFGLWARASERHEEQTRGFEDADSWATDGHKWLNVPYDCGIALVRDESPLRAAMALTAAYLPDSDQRDPMHYSPDASRRARGVDVWAALASLGRQGTAALIDRCCGHASRMAAGLRAAGHNVLNDVRLNQVLVSFGSGARTRRVIEAVQEAGVCWCGGSEWQGQTVMRISVSSWATTDDDVDRSLASILATADATPPDLKGAAS